MAYYRPVKCLLPCILRDHKIEPFDFYNDMGWSKQQYSAYIHMRRVMSAGTLKTVAEYFGLPMDDIYSWSLDKGKGDKQSNV